MPNDNNNYNYNNYNNNKNNVVGNNNNMSHFQYKIIFKNFLSWSQSTIFLNHVFKWTLEDISQL